MRILLDTHYLLWLFLDSSKISEPVQAALLSEKNDICYSQASLWKISIKYALGKLSLQGITPEELYSEFESSFLTCMPLENPVLISSYRLPREHKDPFDRLLIWQAIKNKMPLLSVDRRMRDYTPYGLELFEP